MLNRLLTVVWVLACAFISPLSQAQSPTWVDSGSYPFPLRFFEFDLQGTPVQMAYMDVAPSAVSNGQAVLLMHGKNFGSDYWAHTLRALSQAGYRVIAPDQIGFGQSSKPDQEYRFQDLARHTARLLDQLQLQRVAIVANSMGGMLGVHFARMFPERVSALVLENPIGLEDYAQAIPEQTTEHLQALEMQQTPASYRQFLHHSYFPNWQAEYERYVEQFARTQSNPDYPHLAQVSAQTYQMIYHGPILAELPLLKVPTLLIIGQADRTVFGRRFAPPEAVRSMGNFPALGKAAQQRIPDSKLLEFEGVGHVAHLEVPERFNSAVLAYLKDPH